MATLRRPTTNYNSDIISRMCDDDLEELEEKITALYVNAANEVKAKFTDFSNDFQTEYDEMREALNANKISPEQYNNWLNHRLMQSEAFRQAIRGLTYVLVNADEAAMALVSGDMPYVIAQSYNFIQSLGWAAADEAGYTVGTFQVYNARSVQALIRDNPRLLPKVDLPIDMQWNMDRINREITQGILQGESIPDIADRLAKVTGMDENAAIRNARTAMTYAENLGRDESFEYLKKMGLPVKKRWNAVLDGRTRPTHRQLNGTYADETTGLFGKGILTHPMKCPSDPNGDPWEIYNCRCREGVVFDGDFVDHSQDGKKYEDFLKSNYPDDYEKLRDRDYFRQHAMPDAKPEAKPIPKPEPKPKQMNEPEQLSLFPELDAMSATPTDDAPTYPTASNLKEAKQLLQDMGFGKVSSGVNKIDEKLFVDNVNQLSKLNSRFGAVTDDMQLTTGRMNACAYVSYKYNHVGSVELKLSSNFYNSSTEKIEEAFTDMQKINFWMPAADEYKITSILTHEYGHMLQNKLILTDDFVNQYLSFRPSNNPYDMSWYRNRERFVEQTINGTKKRHRQEIMQIAMDNTGLSASTITTDYLSRYGKKNDAEFFAEVFMNSQCGKPNVLGEAMEEWLRRQGL